MPVLVNLRADILTRATRVPGNTGIISSSWLVLRLDPRIALGIRHNRSDETDNDDSLPG